MNFRKFLLLLVLGVVALASCTFDKLYTREEIEAMVAEEGSAHLTFYVDWSDTETPTGMTLYLFPNTGKPALDTVPYVYHTNTVDVFTTTVPDQDYSVVCFNQSETEFANLKFSFSSFAESQVMLKEENELTDENTKVFGTQITRGFNASGTLRPKGLSIAARPSVKGSITRGFNASGTLRPRSVINGVNLKVNVYGLKSAKAVEGSITNMSAGYRMGISRTIETTCDMHLGNWDLSVNENDSLPGSIETVFGTFGLPSNLTSYAPATRGLADDTQDICLNLSFFLINGDTVRFSRNLTQEFVEQFEKAHQIGIETGETVAEIEVEVGTSTEKVNPDSTYVDNVTEQGGLILPKVVNGLSVGVNDWGDTNIIDISF